MKKFKNLFVMVFVAVLMVLTPACKKQDDPVLPDSFDFTLSIQREAEYIPYGFKLCVTYNYVVNGDRGYQVKVDVDWGNGWTGGDFLRLIPTGGNLVSDTLNFGYAYQWVPATFTIIVRCHAEGGQWPGVVKTILVTVPFL